MNAEGEYGRKVYDVLYTECTKQGVIVEKHLLLESLDVNNIKAGLDEAEVTIKLAIEKYGLKNVAIQVIGGGIYTIEQVGNYPHLNSVQWFSYLDLPSWQFLVDKAPDTAAHFMLFTPIIAPIQSSLYHNLNAKYYANFSDTLNFEMAAKHDAAWIIVRAILESQNTDIDCLLEVIPEVSSQTFGATGYCKLNQAGDRVSADYEIWGLEYSGREIIKTIYGRYDSIWNHVFLFVDTTLKE